MIRSKQDVGHRGPTRSGGGATGGAAPEASSSRGGGGWPEVGTKILVVAGDANSRAVCRHELERAGHLVLAAEDGREALRVLTEMRFNLLVVLARSAADIPFRSTEWVLVHFADLPVIVCTPGDHRSAEFGAWPVEATVRMTPSFAALRVAVARALVRGKTRRFKRALGPPVGGRGAQVAPVGA